MPTTTATKSRKPPPALPAQQVILEDEDRPREMFKLRSSNILGGRTFGGGFGGGSGNPAGAHPATPPRQDSESTENPDKTPSARAKVLPWVNGIEEGTIPDGMFGPYDSNPPTRMPTIHEAYRPPARPHPFAYNAHDSMASGVIPMHEQLPPVPAKDYLIDGRPESDVLGMDLSAPGGIGREPPVQTGGSPGGDTFGGVDARVSPRKAATQLTDSPKRHLANASPSRSVPARPGGPPLEPLPSTPAHPSPARKPVPHMDGPTQDVHLADTAHHHHDHAFSHAEAAQKQAEAMDYARARALAQLEMARGDVEDLPPSGANKGPRGTYETGTSGPSFGHIYHQDGHPVSARQSFQPGPGATSQPMTRDVAGPGVGSFFRIPFGVPMNIPLPRPMMLMRTGTGAGMGIGVGLGGVGGVGGMGMPGLDDVPELDERRRDDRSAFVETVHDEDSPAADQRTHTQTYQSEMPGTVQSVARPESQAQPPKTAGTRTTVGGLPPAFEPDTYPPPAVKHKAKTATKAPTVQSRAEVRTAKTAKAPTSHAAKSARTKKATTGIAPSERVASDHLAAAKQPSIASDTRTHGARSDRTLRADPAPSVAPTSASNIKKLVHESGVHDEVLCQLLDAAKLNLIGSEAKKALQRAARARVIELRDARETQAQMQAALDASHGTRSRDAVREAELRAASATTVAPFSPPPETPDISQQPFFAPPRGVSPESRRAPTALSQAPVPSRPAPSIDQPTPLHGAPSHAPSVHTQRAPTQAALSVHTRRAPTLAASQRAPTVPIPQSITTQMASPPAIDPYSTPRWAKDIRDQMAMLDQRFDELQRQNDMLARHNQSTHDAVPSELLDDILYGTTYPAQPFTPQTAPRTATARDSPRTVRQAKTASNNPRAQSGDVTITWGSEVELPGSGSPVKPSPMMPPIINIQPPTESYARTRAASIPSRTDPRTPAAQTTELDEMPGTGMTGMAEQDKSLPATPAPDTDARGPPSVEVGRGAASYRYDGTNQDSNTTDTIPNPVTHAGVGARPTTDASAMTAEAVTAPTHITHAPTRAGPVTPNRDRDVVHVREAPDAMPSETGGLEPWDAVVQRLYQWAMVWEEESFTKALESTALGKQVESLSLTVFMMMVYKRLLAHYLSSMPTKSCEKLFVPPLMADAINHAVHNKQFENARQMLDDLWYPWGFQTPPRVIIALAKHRNEADKWTAHRFDLSTGHLTSYGVTSDEQNLPDGRPFMWWHAIRLAWPEYSIPDPDMLKQRVEYVLTSPTERSDNSLKAMNYARNLLLGFRPELARDLGKLRETVWEEVKRLANKKRSGHLMVHGDHGPARL